MRHLDESFARLTAHALAGGIRGDELRMLSFETLQPAHQRVVFGVGNFWLVEHVVQVLVVAQLIAQVFDFLACVRGRHLYYN